MTARRRDRRARVTGARDTGRCRSLSILLECVHECVQSPCEIPNPAARRDTGARPGFPVGGHAARRVDRIRGGQHSSDLVRREAVLRPPPQALRQALPEEAAEEQVLQAASFERAVGRCLRAGRDEARHDRRRLRHPQSIHAGHSGRHRPSERFGSDVVVGAQAVEQGLKAHGLKWERALLDEPERCDAADRYL